MSEWTQFVGLVVLVGLIAWMWFDKGKDREYIIYGVDGTQLFVRRNKKDVRDDSMFGRDLKVRIDKMVSYNAKGELVSTDFGGADAKVQRHWVMMWVRVKEGKK